MTPYGFVGFRSAFSLIGVFFGSPNTAADELKIMYGVLLVCIALRRFKAPITLFSRYFFGFFTDSPTCEKAAKCMTASILFPKNAPLICGAFNKSPFMNFAFGWMFFLFPVERLSKMITLCFAFTSRLTVTDPMYPAPPVTKIFMVQK